MPTPLARDFHHPGPPSFLRHCFSQTAPMRGRNISLLSIDYAFRPRLRSRLTLGGLAFPRKPWASGEYVSHILCATHAGILTSMASTVPHSTTSPTMERSPTDPYYKYKSRSFGGMLSPLYFRRGNPRPVSCYALFKGWLLLSQPPGCLGISTSLPHLAYPLGP
jgi:hypothetical protein